MLSEFDLRQTIRKAIYARLHTEHPEAPHVRLRALSRRIEAKAWKRGTPGQVEELRRKATPYVELVNQRYAKART